MNQSSAKRKIFVNLCVESAPKSAKVASVVHDEAMGKKEYSTLEEG